MAANTFIRSSLQQPGKHFSATMDSHKGLGAVREAKENKPSKSKHTVKKWNHCLIVPAIDSECSTGNLSKYCRYSVCGQ